MKHTLRKHTEALLARKQPFAYLKYWTPSIVFMTMLSASDVAACTMEYVVQSGDNYYSIAAKQYGDKKWASLIGRPNDVSDDETAIAPGSSIMIPCYVIEREQDSDLPEANVSEIRFLITGGNAPFTDESLPSKGLMTELVEAAMAQTPETVRHTITWDDNWTKQFGPTPDDSTFDMGFPVFKPDCKAMPQHEWCSRFNFSDPLIQLPIMLFVKADKQFEFNSETDISGKTLCGRKGYPTQELVSLSHSAYSDFTFRLIIEENIEDCFRKIDNGSADAVAVDLFTGANTILDMKLQYQVIPLKRPLSTESLHVVVPKQNPQWETFLDRINLGLERIREDGQYQDIVSRYVDSILPSETTGDALNAGLNSEPSINPEATEVTVAQKSRFDSLSEYIETDHMVTLPPVQPVPTKPESIADGALEPDAPQNATVESSPRPIARPARLKIIAQPMQEPSEVMALTGESPQGSGAPEGPVAALTSVIKPSVLRPGRVTSALPRKTRGNTVVVGVFDLGSEKWGLFKLPTGEIRELRPGQGIAGMVIESISGNTVKVQSKNGLKTLRTGDLIETAQR